MHYSLSIAYKKNSLTKPTASPKSYLLTSFSLDSGILETLMLFRWVVSLK